MKRQIAFVVAAILGFMLSTTVIASAQTSIPKITLNQQWGLQITCPAPNIPMTISVDGSASVNVTGEIWTGNNVVIPLATMPVIARNLGVHTIAVTIQGSVVTLADGSTVTVGGGTLTTTVEVIATPSGNNPPTNPRWIKMTAPIVMVATAPYKLLKRMIQ